MINIIEKNKVEAYRNPSVHIGYVPYSKVCEARDYAITVLPEMES